MTLSSDLQYESWGLGHTQMVNTKMVKSQNKREQCYNLTRIGPGMRNTIHVCTKQVQLLFQQWMHSQILGCSQKSAQGSMWTLGQIVKLTWTRVDVENMNTAEQLCYAISGGSLEMRIMMMSSGLSQFGLEN